jgi:hypothetical protein
MKLYTEEEVIRAIKMARSSYNLFTTPFTYDQHEVLEQLTPIELPSDEEIEEEINANVFIENDNDFLEGAKWMRDKTYGGNK